jgi:hypothetical protein
LPSTKRLEIFFTALKSGGTATTTDQPGRIRQ